MKITLHKQNTVPEQLPPLPPTITETTLTTPPTPETLPEIPSKEQPPTQLTDELWISSNQKKAKILNKKISIPRIPTPTLRISLKSREQEISDTPNEEIIRIKKSSIKGLPPDEIRSPLLLLMRTSGDLDTFEGVPDGLFKIEKAGTGVEKETETKGIILTNNKLFNWSYGGENTKVWVAYEDEATPYPTQVMHDSSLIVKFYEKILLNIDLLKDKQGGLSKWIGRILIAAAIIAIIGYIAFKFGLIDKFIPQAAALNLTVIPT